MARLVAYGHAGVDPKIMGIGPVPATQKGARASGPDGRGHRRDRSQRGVRRAGAARCASDSEFDPEKVNPNGGGISLGHPIGATGAMLTVKALYELQRTGGRYALVTMCIGGGQGIAAVFERI